MALRPYRYISSVPFPRAFMTLITNTPLPPHCHPLSSPRPRLKWNGILAPEYLTRLREEFGDVLVCPGFAAQFGGKADRWNRVYVPGATAGYVAAKAIWSRWEREGRKNPLYQWWPRALEENSIQPIRCKDVLDGIQLRQWQEYRRAYQRLNAVRKTRLRRQQIRLAAEAAAMEDGPEEAAVSLLQMGQGAAASSSSQTSSSPPAASR